MYQCTNSSRNSTSGAKSFGVDVIIEHPCPVFEVALKRSTELLSPKVWCTWLWNPARITASRYHGRLSVNRVSETPCSQSTNLSAFSVVLVSGGNTQPDRWVASCTRRQQPTPTAVGPPHFTTLSSTAIAPSLALARSFNLFHPILNARLEKRLGEKPEESRGFSECPNA